MIMNMVTALNDAFNVILQENPNAVVLGEDVGKDGGVFRVTDGLQKKFGEQRVIDTPLAESSIVGASIGMALEGLHPFPECQFAGFMFLAFSQIVNHAARYRTRTRSEYYLPLTIRAPISDGIRALEHHSESPETYYSHMGGLTVVEPSNAYDAKGLLIKASRMNDPVVFLEPTKLYRLSKMEVPSGAYEVPIGKANIVQEGTELTIITAGTMVSTVMNALQQQQKKVNAEVIDLRTINPIDETTILNSVKKTGRAMIVHEASLSFGWGAEIAARIGEKAIFELDAPIVRVGSPSFPVPLPGYEKFYVPNELKISKAIEKLMSE